MIAVIPQDPAYEAKVRESFGRQGHIGPGDRTLVAVMLSTIIVRPMPAAPPGQIEGPS